jgi:glutamate synthase (NADPH) small chain
VTVFEQTDKVGGLLRYGIPDFKLEKWVIDRRVALLEAEGVRFLTGQAVGHSPTYDEVRRGHDALVLATGARRPRELEVPGRELSGVVQALSYLEAQNREVLGGPPVPSELSARGRKVVILGGGDTGSDCLGTALRQGAAEVTQVELMPMPPAARAAGNPWPQWPVVLRTSSSQEEGGERRFAVLTQRLVGQQGRLTHLEAVEVELRQGPDGRPALTPLEGRTVRLEADLLILALGFTGPETSPLVDQLGLALDVRGNVRADASFATSAPGVYCAGDAMRGASLIVWAISDGREAARAVDAYLQGRPSVLPTRGAHLPFGGR